MGDALEDAADRRMQQLVAEQRSSFAAVEMVAAAVEDRAEALRELERLRAALTTIERRATDGNLGIDLAAIRLLAHEALDGTPPPPACPGEHTTHALGNLIWIECDGEDIARRIFPLPARNDDRAAWVEAELAAHHRPDDTSTTGAER